MSVGVHINSDLFIITVDGSNTLSKNKQDVFCSVSNSDSSVVNIYETTPNESGRNLIFSSAYSNFTSPTGSTASSVCIAINDLIKYGSPQNEIKPKQIEVVLSGSVTTNSLQCLSRFVSNGTNYLNEFEKTGTISGTTPLILVPSEFIATYVSIYNSDTASATVTIRSNNSGTYTILAKVSLDSGYHLFWNSSGWQVLNSSGITPPSGTGTYVPYTGATTDVNIGANSLITAAVKSNSSAGAALKNNSGTDCITWGTGGGQVATSYGGFKLDYATASRIAGVDSSKNLISLDTATYPSLTELSYVKGVTSAIQTQLNALKLIAYNYTPYTLASSTSELVTHSIQISGGVSANDILEVYSSCVTNNSAGTKTFRMYIHTSAGTPGSAPPAGTLVATSASITTTTGNPLSRVFPVLTTTSIRVHGGTTGTFGSQYGASAVTSATVTVPNLSSTFYIIITAQKSTAGDTAKTDYTYVKIHKA